VRDKLFVALTVVGAVLLLYSLYVPWLSFTGLIRKFDEAYEVSGSTYGFGIGTLNRTSAKVTVWSGKYWSTAGSDFWFGWLSIVGVFLVLACTIGFMKAEKLLMLMFMLLVFIGGFLPILASVLTTMYYQPKTFVVDGQIDDYPFQTGIIQAADAVIDIGIGPRLSLLGGVLSIISIISASYFRSKQKE
jgi:hypothetical protein